MSGTGDDLGPPVVAARHAAGDRAPGLPAWFAVGGAAGWFVAGAVVGGLAGSGPGDVAAGAGAGVVSGALAGLAVGALTGVLGPVVDAGRREAASLGAWWALGMAGVTAAVVLGATLLTRLAAASLVPEVDPETAAVQDVLLDAVVATVVALIVASAAIAVGIAVASPLVSRLVGRVTTGDGRLGRGRALLVTLTWGVGALLAGGVCLVVVGVPGTG